MNEEVKELDSLQHELNLKFRESEKLLLQIKGFEKGSTVEIKALKEIPQTQLEFIIQGIEPTRELAGYIIDKCKKFSETENSFLCYLEKLNYLQIRVLFKAFL